jgi:hypothetical protein
VRDLSSPAREFLALHRSQKSDKESSAASILKIFIMYYALYSIKPELSLSLFYITNNPIVLSICSLQCLLIGATMKNKQRFNVRRNEKKKGQ